MSAPLPLVQFYFKRLGAASATGIASRSVSGTRLNSTSIRTYIDGVLDTEVNTLDSGAVAAGLWAHGGLFSNSTTISDMSAYYAQVETIGSGLQDQEMIDLHSIAIAFNNALGRS